MANEADDINEFLEQLGSEFEKKNVSEEDAVRCDKCGHRLTRAEILSQDNDWDVYCDFCSGKK